jgi:hypothetical protein
MSSFWLIAAVLVGVAALLAARGSVRRGDAGDDPAIAALVERLTGLGYFAFTPDGHPPPGPAAEALWGPASRRVVRADAKAIAAGEAAALVAAAAPFLEDDAAGAADDAAGAGDHAPRVAEDRVGRATGVPRYEVVVDGRAFLILAFEEFHDARAPEIAAARALAMLDAVLEAAGAPERAFWLPGADVGRVAFLTLEQAAALLACPAVADRPRRSLGDRFEAAGPG